MFDAARALLSLPDSPGTNEERLERLRLALDQLALAYTQSKRAFDPLEYPAPPPGDYAALRARFASAFPALGLYSAVLDPLTPEVQAEVATAEALDDLTDVALDMQEVLDRSVLSVEDAIWHFRFGYTSHWGRHLRWLQLYLFELAS